MNANTSSRLSTKSGRCISHSAHLLALSVLFVFGATANAAIYTWTGNASSDWNTTDANWSGAGTTWSNVGTNNDAVFNTAGTTISLTEAITANDITFSTTGYTIQNNTLTLSGGTTPLLTLPTTVVARINSSIAGTLGLTYTGVTSSVEPTSLLTLGGSTANTYTGATTVNAGILALSKTAGTTAIVGDIAMNNNSNGTLYFTTNNQLGGSGVLSFINNGGNARFDLFGTTQSLAGLSTTNTNSVIQNSEGVNGAPATAAGGTLTLTGSGSYSYNGILRDATGTLSLVKNGTGTQTLSGANVTYTGGTTLNNGVLDFAAVNNSIGGGIILNGGTLNKTGTGYLVVNGLLEVAVNSTINVTTIGASRNLFFDSGVTGTGNLTINNTGDAFTGVHFRNGTGSFSGDLTVNGGHVATQGVAKLFSNSNVTLNGADFYMDGSQFATGASNEDFKSLNGNGNLIIGNQVFQVGTNNGSGSFSGIISGGASFPLVKLGSGTQVFSGANTYTQATTVNGGTLSLDYSTQDNSKLSNTTALNLGGGTLNLTGGTHTEVVLSTALTAGTASAVTHTGGGTSALQMGAITRNAGATINFSADNIATTNTLNSLSTGIIGPWATVGGTDWAINSGSILAAGPTVPGVGIANGFIRAYTAYTDVTRQTSGPQTISDGSTTNVRIVEGTGGAANITLGAATTTINTLNQSASGGTSAATIDPNSQILAVHGILVGTGAGGLTIGTGVNNGTLRTATASGELILNNQSANGLTINSVIANNTGASTLTKTGSGTATFNAANTYTGLTTVSAGKLLYGGNNAISTGAVTVNGSSAILDLATFTDTVGTVTLDGGGQITSTTGVLTVNSASTFDMRDGTVGAILAGTATLNKTTTGTVTLNRANTYSGTTTLSAGTLRLENANAIQNSALVFNGGTLQLRSDADATFATTAISGFPNGGSPFTFDVNQLTGAGSNKTLTLGNVSVNAGQSPTINITGGNGYSLALGNFTSPGAYNLTLNANSANVSVGTVSQQGQGLAQNLTLGGTLATGNNTIGAISATTGTWSVIKSGPSRWTMTGTSTHAGLTVVGGGVLSVSTVNQLGAGTGGNYFQVHSGGTLEYTGAVGGSTLARDVYWNSGPATIDVTQASANLTLDITGGARNNPFTKAGAGQLTLSKSTAINEITGNPVIITGGILEYNQNNAGAINRFSGTVAGAAGTLIKVSGTGYIGNESLTANWTLNLASLEIGSGASFDMRGQGIQVDALTGAGTVANSFASGIDTLIVGVNNGSGNFSGDIKQTAPTGFTTTGTPIVAFNKVGTGTQTLGGTNTYTGTTTVNDGILIINGTASNTTSGGTFVNNGELHLGKTPGNNAVGGTAIYVGDNAAGAAKVKLLAANQLPNIFFDLNVDSDGTFDMNGFSEEISSLFDGLVSFGGSVTSTVGTPILTLNSGGDFRGTVDGTLALVQTGANGQTLRGINTYTGNTTISGGTFALINSGSNNTIANSPVIHVAAGAFFNVAGLAGSVLDLASGQKLKGSGTVQGNVTVGGGIIAPGSSPGELDINGNQVWADGDTYEWEVANAGIAGIDYDLTDVNGILNFTGVTAGGINLELIAWPGLGVTETDVFALWTYDTLSNWGFADFVASDRFSITGQGLITTNAIVYNDSVNKTIWLTGIQSTPEPSALVLGLFSLVGLSFVRRRHRRA